ncbi:hypothetical protein [Pontibacter brevis]
MIVTEAEVFGHSLDPVTLTAYVPGAVTGKLGASAPTGVVDRSAFTISHWYEYDASSPGSTAERIKLPPWQYAVSPGLIAAIGVAFTRTSIVVMPCTPEPQSFVALTLIVIVPEASGEILKILECGMLGTETRVTPFNEETLQI